MVINMLISSTLFSLFRRRSSPNFRFIYINKTLSISHIHMGREIYCGDHSIIFMIFFSLQIHLHFGIFGWLVEGGNKTIKWVKMILAWS